jgi:hypothetical protein
VEALPLHGVSTMHFLQERLILDNTISVGCLHRCLVLQIAIRQAANAGLTMTGNTVNSGVAGASNSSRTALEFRNIGVEEHQVLQRNTFLNQSGVGTPSSRRYTESKSVIN